MQPIAPKGNREGIGGGSNNDQLSNTICRPIVGDKDGNSGKAVELCASVLEYIRNEENNDSIKEINEAALEADSETEVITSSTERLELLGDLEDNPELINIAQDLLDNPKNNTLASMVVRILAEPYDLNEHQIRDFYIKFQIQSALKKSFISDLYEDHSQFAGENDGDELNNVN